MSNVRCRKCGRVGTSKCARTRSVFPDMTGSSMFQYIEATTLITEIENHRFKIISPPGDGGHSIIERVTLFAQEFLALTENEKKWACCTHEWEHTDECMFGCCKPVIVEPLREVNKPIIAPEFGRHK